MEITSATGKKSSNSLISFLLGILSLFMTQAVPILGIFTSITGLILGIKGLTTSKKNLAAVGIIICAFGLLLSIKNVFVGTIMSTNQRAVDQLMMDNIEGYHKTRSDN